MTFIYTAAVDLAVMLDGDVYSLGEGEGSFALSRLNPDNPAVFLEAILSFDTPRGAVSWTLDASAFRTTGGFRGVDEPAALALLATSAALALLLGGGGRVSRAAGRRSAQETPTRCLR